MAYSLPLTRIFESWPSCGFGPQQMVQLISVELKSRGSNENHSTLVKIRTFSSSSTPRLLYDERCGSQHGKNHALAHGDDGCRLYGHCLVSMCRAQRPPTDPGHASQSVLLGLSNLLLGHHCAPVVHSTTRFQDLGRLWCDCTHPFYVVHIRCLAIDRTVLAIELGSEKQSSQKICALHGHIHCDCFRTWNSDRWLRSCKVFYCSFNHSVLTSYKRYPSNIAKLGTANLIWDKVELGAFFIQETAIALLYIRETALHLKNMTLLGTDRKTTRRVLQQLIWVNVFIICLDCSLIGLCYAGFFFLQGYYKAAIYAVKLRTEFTILNQLRSTLPGQSGHGSGYGGAYAITGNRQTPKVKENAARRGSQDSDVEMVTMTTQNREIRVQKDIVVSSCEKDGRSDYSVTRS
jgi:hypothetical protein